MDAMFHRLHRESRAASETLEKLKHITEAQAYSTAGVSRTHSDQLSIARKRARETSEALAALQPSLNWSPMLSSDINAAIMGRLGLVRFSAAAVCRAWREYTQLATALGYFKARVLSVAAGGSNSSAGSHSVVCLSRRDGLDTYTTVFAWGCSDCGRLGQGSAPPACSLSVCEMPEIVPSLTSSKIHQVTAGSMHTVVASKDSVFSFGSNRCGALGLPHVAPSLEQRNFCTPQLVEALAGLQPLCISAGSFHTAVVTVDGQHFIFGQLHPLLYPLKLGQPTCFPTSPNLKVVAVASGYQHTMALSASGSVFTWGSNIVGQCGHGFDSQDLETLPRVVGALRDRGLEITGIACGDLHSLAWTAGGQLFAWGFPAHGRLGVEGDSLEEDGCSTPSCVMSLWEKECIVKGSAGGTSHSCVDSCR